MEASTSRRRLRWFIAALTALFLTVSGAVGVSADTKSKYCAGTVDGFNWKDGSHVKDGKFESGAEGQAAVSFDWDVEPDAVTGDTFTLSLPDELNVKGSQQILLKDGDSLVGTGVWNGKTLTVTLSDYAASHGHISGKAFFTVEWDRNVVNKDGAEYDLAFKGCKGGGSLPGKYLPEGPSGVNQSSGKSGVLSEDSEHASWAIFVATTTKDVYEPLVVTDLGGQGLDIGCEEMRVFDRTPYPHTEIKDTPIDESRWSCKKLGNGGVEVTFHPMSDGRYQAAGESLMIELTSEVTSAASDLDVLVNNANIRVGEQEPEKVEGRIELPNSGGEGSGHRAEFNVSKAVVGNAPEGAAYVFSYKCRADEFLDFEPLHSGETSKTISTKSSSTCTIVEKDVPESADVSFEISGSEATVKEVTNGVAITFAPGVRSSVSVKATNTFHDDPSPEPTDDPSPEPTDDPSPEPTDDPSPEPTDDPSPEPTDDPSNAGPGDDSQLPNTGAGAGTIWTLVAGMVLLVAGILMVRRRA